MNAYDRAFRTLLSVSLVCMLLWAWPTSSALVALAAAVRADSGVVIAEDWDPTAAGVDVFTPAGVQIAGQDRVQTAVEVSKFGWGNADSVVIATARQFPDALVGGPLAALLDAPILLSEPGRLPSAVRAEIQRLGASSAVILGGRSAVGDAVVDDLVALGIARNQIVRIGGTDRYDTARLVAHHVCDTTGLGDRAAIAVGTNYPDALAVSVLASRMGMPILLTRGTQLSSAAAEVLTTYGTSETLIAGGEAAISSAVADQLPGPVRIGGIDRFETATLLGEYATRFGFGFEDIFVATGRDFPDALAVGPLVSKMGGTLVLASPTTLPVATGEFIARHCSSIETIHYVGGHAAIGPAVRAAIMTASETRVSRAVKVVDAATESALETITPDGTMLFNVETAQLMGLEPGTILAAAGTIDGEPGGLGAPDGYLRRVISAPEAAGMMSGADAVIAVETTEVSLEEVFEKGSIDFSEPVEEIEPLSQGLEVLDGALVASTHLSPQAGFQVGFDITQSYEFQLAKGNDNLETGVKATGLLHVEGGAYINVSIRSWKLQTFAAGVYGGQDLDLSVNAWLSAQVEKERELFSKRVARTRFSVGPVPVMIDFVLSGKVVFEASGEVGFLAGVSQSASFHFGYEYKRGTYGDSGDGWRQIREQHFGWSRTGPEIWANAEAKAYGRIQLDVKFYGIGGPYVGFNAGFEFAASTPVFSPDFPPGPPGSTDGYTCELNAFVDVVPGVAVKVKVWRFTVLQLSIEWPIRLATWNLYEHDPPPIPPGDAPSLAALIPVDTSTVDLYFTALPGDDLAVTPSKFHITAGDSPGGTPLTVLGVSSLGGGHVRIQTAEHTEECYWIQCEVGGVTDFASRSNTLIDKPYMAAYPVELRMLVEDVGWGGPTPDISGFDGESRFVVWRDYSDSPMSVGWYDLAEDTAGNTPCDDSPFDLGVSGSTVVWHYWGYPEVYPAEIWMQELPSGSAFSYAENLWRPQLADGWLMYETETDPAWVAADRLPAGHSVTISADASELKERTLGDGMACLLFWDGSIDTVDLMSGLVRPVTGEPRNLSNIRIDDGRIVCLEDSSRIVYFDLAEETPVAHELPGPTPSWDRFELYGTTIVAYDSWSRLWAGDLAKYPVRWRPLLLPVGFMAFEEFAVYGSDIVVSIASDSEEVGLYLISP